MHTYRSIFGIFVTSITTHDDNYPIQIMGQHKIVNRPFTYKKTMNGITNRNRKKSAYNDLYSTLCAKLKTKSQANLRIIMGDGDDLLQPFQ